MIVTRRWLEEWMELDGIQTDDICKKLNEIGLEVDGVEYLRVPKGVVVGFVKSCEKHPDAQKLSVCQVDVGSQTLNIVCGAPNVALGQFVAVATNGTTMPNGLEIKAAKLRGVESNGMLCSSTELGFAKINDGIMLLDESIGELTLGTSVGALLDDDVIEIGLTPNRGDCLSVRGVARDLSAVFKKELKEYKCACEEDNYLGIGRALGVHVEGKLESSFVYKLLSQENFKDNLLIELRLATVELKPQDALQKLIEYATYSTGVLLRAYDKDSFESEGEKATVVLKKDESGLELVCGKEVVSQVGFNALQKASKSSSTVVLEASYAPVELMSALGAKHKNLPSDKHLYRSARGSETDLDLGVEFCLRLINQNCDAKVYVGEQRVQNTHQPKSIVLDLNRVNLLIGQDTAKSVVIDILKSLNFEISVNAEQNILHVGIPSYRHDVENEQDLCEEIVRIIGIDNITSKPYSFSESSRANATLALHRFKTSLRYKAAGVGFNESMHFCFDDKKLQEKYKLLMIKEEKELLNPITSELNTLRTTLALHLLNACSFNTRNSQKRVPLFEIGRVFDEDRNETNLLGFVFCGELEEANVTNHGKPQNINFFEFAKKISSVIGEFELVKAEPNNLLTSPYEYAHVVKNGKVIGYIARVHALVERDFDLSTTYLCEIVLDELLSSRVIAKEYSKFQASTRDLSLIVPKDFEYKKIADVVKGAKIANLISVNAIDIFTSEKLGDKMSLTVKLTFQNINKTLEEQEIQDGVDGVLSMLNDTLGIGIR